MVLIAISKKTIGFIKMATSDIFCIGNPSIIIVKNHCHEIITVKKRSVVNVLVISSDRPLPKLSKILSSDKRKSFRKIGNKKQTRWN